LGVAATLPVTKPTAAITTPAQGEAAPDALSALVALLQADLEATNRAIVARMDSPVALIPQLAAHIVAAGGKRLRPLLTLASARLCGYEAPEARHVKLAACVEFIHTATLLHDDVVDESLLRRGLASANAVFGNKASVLVGDFLFARAFQLMVEDGSLRVLDRRQPISTPVMSSSSAARPSTAPKRERSTQHGRPKRHSVPGGGGGAPSTKPASGSLHASISCGCAHRFAQISTWATSAALTAASSSTASSLALI
jgi:hypothetical protein